MTAEHPHWHTITRSVVFPWHCDHYGHMNVRWYGHVFDDATLLIWSLIGVDMRAVHAGGVHTVIAKSTIEFVQESRAGDSLEVRGAFTRLGNRSTTVSLEMREACTQALRAKQETVIVFFDAAARTSAPIPADVRAHIEAALADAPA